MTYAYDPSRVSHFAMTDVRNQRKAFGIRAIDRAKHMYVIGKTGMGKSTLLENLAIQDIQRGEGMCFIDPHGSTAEKLLNYVPQDRVKDVIYFAPFDTNHPIGFNVMEDVGYDRRHLVASGLMSAFHRIWGEESWSARMEYILQNVLLALLEYPDTTLGDVSPMLLNQKFRNRVLEKISDPLVKRYWKEEFTSYTEKYKQEAIPGILNKIGQFVSNPLIRNIVSQPKSSFDMRDIMDSRKIFIVNLSKGRIGESNADMLGSMIVVKLYLAAMSRAEEGARIASLPPFYLYVDEFQSVVNSSFENILSEARKYKLCLTIAHQYIEQVPEEVRAAVFGNVGTTIAFRVGPFDSEVLEKVFNPVFTAQDLVGLGFAQIYLSLMIDGVGSKPFSAQTLPPINEPEVSYAMDAIDQSRTKYSVTRAAVEEIIRLHAAKVNGVSPQQGGGQQGGGQNQQNNQPKKQKDGNQPKQQNQPQNNNQQQKQQQPAAPQKQGTGLTAEEHRNKLKEALEKLAQKERELEDKKSALNIEKKPSLAVPPVIADTSADIISTAEPVQKQAEQSSPAYTANPTPPPAQQRVSDTDMLPPDSGESSDDADIDADDDMMLRKLLEEEEEYEFDDR
jgi:ABC-type oligopeptide transport system ATPase subunit